MSDVTVEHLSVVMNQRPLVDDVTLDVPTGSWLTVIGPNGAGKTTFVEALAAVRSSTHGIVRVGGRVLHQLRERERAQLVAFVPQHPVVPVGMAVRDYVGLGRTAHQGVMQALNAAGHALVAELLERVGLVAMSGRDVSTLSGGERQRAVLARALAQSTPVLVLDEPTTGLDLRHQIEMLDLLRREVQERHLTIVATLHDLTLAGQYADRLALLDEGRLVAIGSSREVVRSRELADAYRIGLRVLDVDGADVIVPTRSVRDQEPR